MLSALRSPAPHVGGLSLALLILLGAIPASSQPVAMPGDLVLSAYRRDTFFGLPSSDITVMDSTGVFKFQKQVVADAGEMLFDPNGNLHLVRDYFSGWALGRLATYSPGIDQIAQIETATAEMDLTMDAAGTIWTLGVVGHISILPVTGPPLQRQRVSVSQNHIVTSGDIALDQCTLYYVEVRSGPPAPASSPRVKRHDICRNAALPDLPFGEVAPCHRPKLRVAPDGSLFLASCSAVYHLTEGGVRTYAMPFGHTTEAFALGADGGSFWSASLGKLFQIDLVTGAVLRGPLPVPSGSIGLLIYGVPRAAVQSGLAAIPTHSFAGLGVFVLIVVLVSFQRLAR